MTAPLTTEQVEEILARVVGVPKLSYHNTQDYAEITGENWLQAMCMKPDAIIQFNHIEALATELLALRKRVGELEEREVKNGRITAVWDEDMGQFRPLPTPKEPS